MQTDLVSLAPRFAAEAVVHVSVAVGGVTAGRGRALATLLLALISAGVGRLALARAAADRGTGAARTRAVAALVVGLIGVALSGQHLASSTAIGTGSGRLGAIVALVVGLIGVALGALALARSRRTD